MPSFSIRSSLFEGGNSIDLNLIDDDVSSFGIQSVGLFRSIEDLPWCWESMRGRLTAGWDPPRLLPLQTGEPSDRYSIVL
jgi:hypothetical protein